MENITSAADIAWFMTRLVFVLLGLRALVWWMQFDGEKPYWWPFKTFRWVCSLGDKQPIEKLTDSSEFTKFRYLDNRYQAWKEKCVNEDKLTHSELMAFEHQAMIEIEHLLNINKDA